VTKNSRPRRSQKPKFTPQSDAEHLAYKYYQEYGLDPSHSSQKATFEKLTIHFYRTLAGKPGLFDSNELTQLHKVNKILGTQLRRERSHLQVEFVNNLRETRHLLVAVEEIAVTDTHNRQYSNRHVPDLPTTPGDVDLEDLRNQLDKLVVSKTTFVKAAITPILTKIRTSEFPEFLPTADEVPVDWDVNLKSLVSAYKHCVRQSLAFNRHVHRIQRERDIQRVQAQKTAAAVTANAAADPVALSKTSPTSSVSKDTRQTHLQTATSNPTISTGDLSTYFELDNKPTSSNETLDAEEQAALKEFEALERDSMKIDEF
jgi:hypothetical protein